MIELSVVEARVLGCLIEKAITTPDQYPLSLNALTNACNQKSNREPLMDMGESAVQATLDALIRKHLVLDRSGFGSRVRKYQHRFCNTGFGTLEFTPIETAVLCELLLRGLQTAGELRTRAARMAEVNELGEVQAALNNLATRADGPFIVQLPREAHRREVRYAHLFCGAELPLATISDSTAQDGNGSLRERVASLEQQVAALQDELAALKNKLGEA